jgi:hypothetical protein
LRKRQVWVEPLFARDYWHGSRRFSGLGRYEKVNAEDLLIAAAGQKCVKRLLTYGQREARSDRHRWPPCARRLPTHTSSVAFAGIATGALLGVQRGFSTP